MDDFKNRLVSFIRNYLKISFRKFEENCALTNGTVSSIREQGPTTSVLSKISDTYPELNMNWLLSGKGGMLNKANMACQLNHEHTLPLIPFEAVAGPGTPVYEDEKVENYYTVSEFKESDFLIRVKGDSMAPHFTGGDLLACKKVSETYFLQWGRCYVVYTRSQGCMVKRVQPSEKEGYIKCVSDNAKYAPFDVPMDDIVSVALVNGSISLE